MLKRWVVRVAVLEAVPRLDLDIFRQVQRPRPTWSGVHKKITELNEHVFIDDFEIVMTDGTLEVFRMILDDASDYRAVIPTTAVRSITGHEARKCFEAGWNWPVRQAALRRCRRPLVGGPC